MALTTEELAQIREIVRSEIAQANGRRRSGVAMVLGSIAAVFVAVVGLHVLVIGGFTVYHLIHS